MIGGNFNSIANRASQNQMSELRNQFKSDEIDSKEYREKLDELRGQREDLRVAAAQAGMNAAQNVSTLFSYMNGGGNSGGSAMWGGGTFDQSVFFGANSELSQLQAMNSARVGIESRARELVGEIGRDRAMGRDVSDRQEALANLTGNLDILNKNLSNSIDKALGDGKKDSQFVDIVGRIKDTLAAKAPEGSLVPNEVPRGEDGKPLPPATEPAAPSAPVEPPATEAPAPLSTPEALENATAPAVEPQSAEVAEQPGFAPPPEFEGGPAEQAVAASQEQDVDDMSLAAQIASNAKAEYAESVDIMNDDVVAESGAAGTPAGASPPPEEPAENLAAVSQTVEQ